MLTMVQMTECARIFLSVIYGSYVLYGEVVEDERFAVRRGAVVNFQTSIMSKRSSCIQSEVSDFCFREACARS